MPPFCSSINQVRKKPCSTLCWQPLAPWVSWPVSHASSAKTEGALTLRDKGFDPMTLRWQPLCLLSFCFRSPSSAARLDIRYPGPSVATEHAFTSGTHVHLLSKVASQSMSIRAIIGTPIFAPEFGWTAQATFRGHRRVAGDRYCRRWPRPRSPAWHRRFVPAAASRAARR